MFRTHSYEHLQAFPLAPWVEVLNALLDTSRHQSVEKRTSVAGHWLEKRVPDLLELAPLLNPLLALSFPMSDVVRSLDGMGRQNRLFYLVQRIVEAEARSKGLILVFEDLHWTDVTSLDLLKAVADWVQAGRALLIATSRPSEVHLELGAAAHSLRLRELTRAESMRMVLSVPGIGRLPPEVADTIYAKTRGNPLFLEEVIHALQAPGVLGAILEASSVDLSRRMAALAIPDRVQGLLMSRVDRLPVGAREVIKVASVVGQTFDEETVRGIGDVIVESIPLDFAFRDLVAAGLTVADNSRGQPVRGACGSFLIPVPARARTGSHLQESPFREETEPAQTDCSISGIGLRGARSRATRPSLSQCRRPRRAADPCCKSGSSLLRCLCLPRRNRLP